MTSPQIILVEPQLGENIGACARAMANFGFSELRIVSPRDGWPNEKAEEMSASGIDVIKNAQIFDSLEDAIADLNYLIATSARPRDMQKPTSTPREYPDKCSEKTGIMFGRERSGLTNDEIVLADLLVTIPVSESYPSINIAQSVNIMCYELYSSSLGTKRSNPETSDWISTSPSTSHNEGKAPKKELNQLYNHLETELDKSNFFKVPEKRKKMIQNIRNMLARAELTDQEVKTYRGIIASLSGKNISK